MFAEGTARPNHVLCLLQIQGAHIGPTKGEGPRHLAPSRTSYRSARSFYLRLVIVRWIAQPNLVRVGSRLCLMQEATEGAKPEVKPKEMHRRKSDVEDNGHEDLASVTLVTVQTISSS